MTTFKNQPLGDKSCRELARLFLTWQEECEWYAILKFGRETWRDALANELFSLENEQQFNSDERYSDAVAK